MNPTTESVPVEAPPHAPLHRRINVRLIVFAAIILVPILSLTYLYLKTNLTGGVEHLSDGTVKVDLKSISTFSFDQNNGTLEDVPALYRQLDGKRVVVEGEIWAPNSASNRLRQFELVYSIAKCCFSGPPQIQHFVQSQVVDGKTVPYYSGLVRAVGILHVDVVRQGGKVVSVYQLDIEHLEPV